MYKEDLKLLNKNKGRYHLFKAFLICFDKCKFCEVIVRGPRATAQKLLMFFKGR